METSVFTRQQLYDTIWSAPISTIAKQFDITEAGLRKICTDMNVPLPPNGHWQKIRYGKPVTRFPLPSDYQGSGQLTLTPRDESTPKTPTRKATATQLQASISLPEKLTNPDPLVISARKNLAGERIDSFQYIGTKSTHWDFLNMRIAVGNIDRALLIMDTFIKNLRTQGHDLQVKNHATYVILSGQKFKIQLREKMKKQVIKGDYGPRTAYLPTNLLSIKMDNYLHKEWTDGKLKLEEQFGMIITYLKEKAKEENERHAKWERQRQEEALEKQRQQEFEKKQEKELAAFTEMLSGASRWHKASNLRCYIAAIEENAKTQGTLTAELTDWLIWARKKADWYDPFTEEKDELLDGVNKETLTVKKKPTGYLSW